MSLLRGVVIENGGEVVGIPPVWIAEEDVPLGEFVPIHVPRFAHLR